MWIVGANLETNIGSLVFLTLYYPAVGVVRCAVNVIPSYWQSFSMYELNMLNKTGFVKSFHIYSFLLVNKNIYISIEPLDNLFHIFQICLFCQLHWTEIFDWYFVIFRYLLQKSPSLREIKTPVPPHYLYSRALQQAYYFYHIEMNTLYLGWSPDTTSE